MKTGSRAKTFGEKLTEWRIENEFSQKELAEKLNCSSRTIGAWERGEKLPGFDSIIAVAKLTGTTADFLLGL